MNNEGSNRTPWDKAAEQFEQALHEQGWKVEEVRATIQRACEQHAADLRAELDRVEVQRERYIAAVIEMADTLGKFLSSEKLTPEFVLTKVKEMKRELSRVQAQAAALRHFIQQLRNQILTPTRSTAEMDALLAPDAGRGYVPLEWAQELATALDEWNYATARDALARWCERTKEGK